MTVVVVVVKSCLSISEDSEDDCHSVSVGASLGRAFCDGSLATNDDAAVGIVVVDAAHDFAGMPSS